MTVRIGLALTATTALLIATLLLAVGAAGAAGPAAASPTSADRVPAKSSGSKRAVLRLKNTRFGKVIHEKSSGLAAYLFTRESGSKSKCYGACAKAWPPIKSKKKPKAGSGLKQRHIGTTKRRGGTRMVTYKGHPLYFYEHDSPGRILCHDVFEFGGDWFVVNEKGKPA